MKSHARPIIGLLALSVILSTSALVRADGGTVRLRERAGAYQIAVFTSPTPLRAGPVDFSVLVQDAATGAWTPAVQVTVRLTSRRSGQKMEFPASAEAATNKLYRAAVFRLPEAGSWDVEVAMEGPNGPASVHFEADVAEPPPPWQDYWPWFAWPALAVALFGIHQLLVRRRLR